MSSMDEIKEKLKAINSSFTSTFEAAEIAALEKACDVYSPETMDSLGIEVEPAFQAVIAQQDYVPVGKHLNINSVIIPVEMENNITTGHEKTDILMAGDGVTPSTACLVTGIPGAGKTTYMLQIADSVTKTGNIALYNSCEESLVQVSKVGKRLRLQHGFNVSSHRDVFDIIAHASSFQKENPGKQVFLFVDSLQTIEVPHVEYDENLVVKRNANGEPILKKGRGVSGQSMQIKATELLTTWCKKTYGIVFLIGQVNKDGEFAGRQAIKHWIDCHLHLNINKDRWSSDYGSRTMEMTKNRFGIAGTYFPFELEARGLRFTEPKPKKA
jgi:DNA repair protein RadA/Sms